MSRQGPIMIRKRSKLNPNRRNDILICHVLDRHCLWGGSDGIQRRPSESEETIRTTVFPDRRG